MRRTVLERDRHSCLNCRAGLNDETQLDCDHNVSRGIGGANGITNLGSLCRRCHEAKHGERPHAPTIQFVSSGRMPDRDFRWFKHFWNDQLTALTKTVLTNPIAPVRDINENFPFQAWHIPIGDLRRLDEELAKRDDIDYGPMEAHHYMK